MTHRYSEVEPDALGTLVTFTTYGTWLRGDGRGWIEDGELMPVDPVLESADRSRMTHPVWLFDPVDFMRIGAVLGEKLIERQKHAMYALTIQVWHVHFVIGPNLVPISDIAKCGKDAVRFALQKGRPLWTAGFDKRWCYDVDSLRNRIRYVERHNERMGWPPKPWDFIIEPPWQDLLG